MPQTYIVPAVNNLRPQPTETQQPGAEPTWLPAVESGIQTLRGELEQPEVPEVSAAETPHPSNGQTAKREETPDNSYEPKFEDAQVVPIPSEDEFEAMVGRSVFEPDEVAAYRKVVAAHAQPRPEPKKSPSNALSRLVPKFGGRKKVNFRKDTELYGSLKDAVSEGNESTALRIAKKGNRRFAESGKIMVANALHELPYSRRVEKLLRKMEKKTDLSGRTEVGYLGDVARSYADKRKGVGKRIVSEPVERIATGPGNEDLTHIQFGKLTQLPTPVQREERSFYPKFERVVAAAAGIAVLLGGMNAWRNAAEQSSDSLALPPPAVASPAPDWAPDDVPAVPGAENAEDTESHESQTSDDTDSVEAPEAPSTVPATPLPTDLISHQEEARPPTTVQPEAPAAPTTPPEDVVTDPDTQTPDDTPDVTTPPDDTIPPEPEPGEGEVDEPVDPIPPIDPNLPVDGQPADL
jgi:hypothetical protein